MIKEAKNTAARNEAVKLLFASHERFFDEAGDAFKIKWEKESEITKIPGSVSPGDLLGFFQNRGIFESVTALILSQAEKLSKPALQALYDFVKKPMGGVALLIEYEGDLTEKNKKLEKPWREITRVLAPQNTNPSSARAYINKRIKKDGLLMEEEALESLELWMNKEISLLPSALDLLCLAAMETKTVTAKDVSDLLGIGGSPNIFQLQDKFLQKDIEGVVGAISKIENDENSAPLAFVTVISKQLILMMKLHALLAGGESAEDIRAEMVEKALPFWQFEKVKRDCGKWSADETHSALNSLVRLDGGLKGGAGDPWAAVERHLLSILNESMENGATAY